MDPEEIRVKQVIEGIYAEHGFVPTSKKSNDPTSAYELEKEACRRALTRMGTKERMEVEGYIKRLSESCRGVYMGKYAAMQILMHLGVFLSMVEERKK